MSRISSKLHQEEGLALTNLPVRARWCPKGDAAERQRNGRSDYLSLCREFGKGRPVVHYVDARCFGRMLRKHDLCDEPDKRLEFALVLACALWGVYWLVAQLGLPWVAGLVFSGIALAGVGFSPPLLLLGVYTLFLGGNMLVFTSFCFAVEVVRTTWHLLP